MSRLPQALRASLAAVRPAGNSIASSSRLAARPLQAVRPIHNSRPIRARYDRFDPSPSWNTASGGGGGGPRGPGVKEYLRRRLGGDRAIWVYGIGIGGGGLYYVTHLERTPETGRLRFMDVNEAQERELGSQTQLQTLSEYQTRILPPNHPVSKRVRRVAQRIIESSGLGRMKSGGEISTIEQNVPNWGGGAEAHVGDILMADGSMDHKEGKDVEWEVYVIDDKKTKNAFVTPGGKIFVFTGILPVSGNDDGLATVLGHEVAHQVLRHGAERMSSMKVLFALGLVLESLGLDVGISRLLLTFLMQLPNSRKSESEADFVGLRLMSRACYDPSESTRMWQRMSESEGGSSGLNVDFLSTHPANAKRIQQLTKWLPEVCPMFQLHTIEQALGSKEVAQQIRAASPCGATGSQYGGFLDALSPASSSWH